MKMIKLVQISLVVMSVGSLAHAVMEGDFPERNLPAPAVHQPPQVRVQPPQRGPITPPRYNNPPIMPPRQNYPPPQNNYPPHNGGYNGGHGGSVTTQTLSCSSIGGKTTQCYAGRGYVRMIRQISSASCVQGTSWNYNVRTGYIEVRIGCRAEFEITGNSNPNDDIVSNMNCDSEGGRYNSCRVNVRQILTVDLLRQNSKTACVFGQTWGYDTGLVWVDKGCRGTFRVTGF